MSSMRLPGKVIASTLAEAIGQFDPFGGQACAGAAPGLCDVPVLAEHWDGKL